MNGWPPQVGKPIPLLQLGAMQPENVWHEVDGVPILFCFRDRVDQLFLAYLSDRDTRFWRLLVTPLPEERAADIRSGRLKVRDYFMSARRGPLYIVDLALNRRPRGAWLVPPDTLPVHALPAADFRLNPQIRITP